MKFKWDNKELIPGESPRGEKFEPLLLPALALFMFWFIEVAAPFLGRFFFGGFL